jgi:hypothetical protein
MSWHLSPSHLNSVISYIFSVGLCVYVAAAQRQRVQAATEEKLGACSVCMCISVWLLGNNSVNTFQQQNTIVGCIVSYAVSVVSMELKDNVISKIIFFYSLIHVNLNFKGNKILCIIYFILTFTITHISLSTQTGSYIDRGYKITT